MIYIDSSGTSSHAFPISFGSISYRLWVKTKWTHRGGDKFTLHNAELEAQNKSGFTRLHCNDNIIRGNGWYMKPPKIHLENPRVMRYGFVVGRDTSKFHGKQIATAEFRCTDGSSNMLFYVQYDTHK